MVWGMMKQVRMLVRMTDMVEHIKVLSYAIHY